MTDSGVSYIVYYPQEVYSIVTKTTNLPPFGINRVINIHKVGNYVDSFHIRRMIVNEDPMLPVTSEQNRQRADNRTFF